MKSSNSYISRHFMLALAVMFLTLTHTQKVCGQATCSTPTNIANFGIDGDVYANTASVMGDSWFYKNIFPGPGIGVIGTTAASAIPAMSSAAFNTLVQTGSVSARNRTYVQRMSVPYLTQVSGMTLIDAFAARDNFSPDSTAFTGSNKNGDNPSIWTIGTTSVPNKNDIIDVGGHLRRQTSMRVVNGTALNDLWMFAYVTRLGTSGDAYTDIEIYRTVPYINTQTGQLLNTGPAATGGHTAFSFTSTGEIAAPGDIIICINYNGSGGVASARIWCDIANLDGNGNGVTWFNAQPNRPFNLTGDFISGVNANGYGYAEIQSLSGLSCIVYSVLNTANTPAGDWGNLTGASASYDTIIEPLQLVNIAFNFTDIGLDFSTLSGPCFNVFGALWFKTRSSSSYSSELKDACGPYTFGNFSEIQANAGPDKILNCTALQVTLDGSSATPGAIINWTTPNGNIVSGATTATPVVNAPGTYYMSASNPTLSTCTAVDTVIVTRDITPPNANAGPDMQISCTSPTITLTGSSSTPGVIYSWTAINDGNIVSGGNTATPVVNAAGCYIITVTNTTNGCINTDTACVSLNIGTPSVSGVNQNNVGCFSNCTGSISLTVSGGQTPYAYNWSSGATSSSINNLCAGNYTVTITGSNGCTTSASYSITQPAASLTASTSVTQNVNCTGGSNGSASVITNGGTSPYTYLWSNGNTNATNSGLSAGTYTVTVTDQNGCTIQTSATVTQPANLVSLSLNVSPHIYCYGGSNGVIYSTPSGGTGPYAYLWNTGATTQNLTNVGSGSYTVTITDANGCSAVQSAIVNQPSSALTASPSMSQSVACYGGSNGSASVTAAGGTTPYSYNWSNGATSTSITGLTAGIYTVTVTDAYGCTTVNSTSITQPSASLSSSVTSSQNVNCFGGNNGSLNLSVNGGTAPYSYNWSNGATTQDISNLAAGTYTVTVTDSRGCTSITSSTLSQPVAALTSTLSVNQAVSCFGGNNGSISNAVNGGTAPYTYLWSNGATTQNISGLSTGTYTVTITDANGCSAIRNITVSQPVAALSGSLVMNQAVSCYNGTNGSLNLTVNGGTSPYTYAWSNGASTQDLSGVSAGTYTVTVTDANGCTYVQSGMISQPSAALSASVVPTQNVSCFGGNNGSVNLTVNGGTPAYSYLWSNGITTQDMGSLAAGTYTVTVTDANGCTTLTNVTVNQPSAALSTSITSSQNVNCFGGNNGSINLTVTNGTSPYTYNWSNGASTQDLSGLSAGTYSVTVTDANGCTSVQSATITQPVAALSSSAVINQNVSCFGGANGSVNLTVSGGTPPYSYNWSNGQTTEDMSGLSAGSYTVTITDSKGCTTTRTISISQPAAALSAAASQSQAVSCNGGDNGQITLAVNGGTSPYTYLWSTGATSQAINGLSAGTYTVTVTDANGCITNASATITQPSAALSGSTTTTSNISCFSGSNGSIDLTVAGGTSPYTFMWSNGSTTEDLSGLPAGSYSVTITDANGCTALSGGTITQPAGSLAANLNVSQNVACFGGGNGSLDLTVSGGTTPYTYLWSNGATTEDLNGLPVGTYTVSITDANGCISSATGTISQPSAALSSSINVTQNVSCFGGNDGAVNLTVNGGTTPYSYNWSNGATSQDINNLATGTYTVTITDANGCTTIQSGSVAQPAAALNASTTVSSNVNCFGGGNGSVNLSVSGGTTPYTFSWSNGATTEDLNGLSGGVYTVIITDVNGCNTSATATVTEPVAPVSVTVTSSQAISCFGGNDGQAAVSVTGGTTPYTYLWNTGATASSLNGLTTGTYTVTVTDNNGCTESTTVTLSQPIAPLVSSVTASQNVSCFGGTDGMVDLTVSGGTSPYTYSWNTGANTQDISGLSNGTYTVTVTDGNNCTTTQTISISQPSAALSGSAVVTANISCFSGNNGSIDLTVTGGTLPYTYQWSTGATTEDIGSLGAGIYTVTITDANGCVTTQSAQVTQPAFVLSSTVNASQNVNCFGGTNGLIDLTVSGGTLPYNFIWNNGETTEDLNNLVAGTYTVNITDANGCTTANTITISQPSAALAASITGSINVSCFGGNNGNVDLNVTGGTTPYTFNWNNGAATEDLTGLTAGTYAVTITDANGCTSNASVTITEPAAALNPVLTMTQQINCFGGEDGAIDLTVTGGTLPYSFIWSTGDTTEDVINLMAGTYVVIITDANGCEATGQITLSQPVSPLLGFALVTSNVFCNGGSDGAIDLTVTGGTAPYTFIWSNGATTEDLSNLPTGTYTVTVTDANGCTTSVTEGIGQPSQQLSAGVSIQQVLCFGGNNALIDLTPSGGTPPYSFIWSTGAVSEDIGGLFAGTYTVTVTDANGCDTTLVSTIAQPAAPLIPALTIDQNVSCYGGSDGGISVAVTGGTPPYAYLWNTGATTSSINSLPAGSYTVTVTDANGCNAIISDFVNQPAAPVNATITMSQAVSCNAGSDGSLIVNVTGGTSPYTYLWSTGSTSQGITGLSAGVYTVTVTDANGCTYISTSAVTQPANPLAVTGSTTIANCLNNQGGTVTIQVTGGTPMYSYNWSNGSTLQNLSNAFPGSYTVTVTDANGCTTTGTFVVGNNSQFNLYPGGPTTICVGETVTLIADSIPGGSYQWFYQGNILTGATANTFTTAASGYYSVSITVPCGTFYTDSIQVIVKSVENATITNNQIICPPESVQLLATGGVTYQWTPSSFITFTNVPDPIVNPVQTTTYSVLITNEWGCSTTLDVVVATACDTLFIPNGFSPNDDGTNDGYVIDGIENYPGNKLWVYNRWGNLVYKAKDYRNKWEGVSNVTGLFMGRKLPSGTYYFILDLNDNSKPRAGYLIIRR